MSIDSAPVETKGQSEILDMKKRVSKLISMIHLYDSYMKENSIKDLIKLEKEQRPAYQVNGTVPKDNKGNQ